MIWGDDRDTPHLGSRSSFPGMDDHLSLALRQGPIWRGRGGCDGGICRYGAQRWMDPGVNAESRNRAP